MEYPTVFDLIAAEFKKAGISAVLVGGFALNAYKVTRQTADIDFLVTQRDYQKVALLLKNDGYRESAVTDLFARFENDVVKYLDIDLLFVDEGTLEKIKKSGKNFKIAGHSFVIPSIEHLIAMKLHAIKQQPKERELKDMVDIIELIRENMINVKDPAIKKLCLTYGTAALYDKIKSAVE
ncbi:MAG TPA: nucleotidyl transferase AbiEii/AbiGii toxin family protein [bacterium]|nr:nucleotidyl transferase AbiEii/AbiGii toxin family protein [bacterium]